MQPPTEGVASVAWQCIFDPGSNAYYYWNTQTNEVRWEWPASDSTGFETAAAAQPTLKPMPQPPTPQLPVPQPPIPQPPIPQQIPQQEAVYHPTAKPIPWSLRTPIAAAMGHAGHVRADLRFEDRMRGRLIGKQGSQKAAMEASTGTHIFIPDTAPLVVIIGPPSAVAKAKHEIASFCTAHGSQCYPWD